MTPKSALPQHAGRPVPWITRWTGEVSHASVQVSVAPSNGAVHLNYTDGSETRDDHGVLWKREGVARLGTPQYSEINTYRQRAAMSRRLCQVCGSKINERPIRWLMGKTQLHRGEQTQPWGVGEDQALTMSAPTCSACIPLALELCPHLKRDGYLILKVLDYEPWGVYGEAIRINPETPGKAQSVRGVYVPYDEPPVELTAIVALQQVVLLAKYIIEEES